MVDFIDIKELTLEELGGVVNLYPWFGAARSEYCSRLSEMGACSESQLAQAALYVCSRRILYDIANRGKKADCSDENVSSLVRGLLKEEEKSAPAEQKRIFVVGGDYFSQSEYNSVRSKEDSIYSAFATSEREGLYREDDSQEADFCTETLAKIYEEQGYCDEAKAIYSKLILRYPEKSVYFAALIDKINKN